MHVTPVSTRSELRSAYVEAKEGEGLESCKAHSTTVGGVHRLHVNYLPRDLV
jgi:hypothetical protein